MIDYDVNEADLEMRPNEALCERCRLTYNAGLPQCPDCEVQSCDWDNAR